MKDFSNETKNKRRKAILKVILKRYSFIVWVPALLVLLNFIGSIVIQILNPLSFSVEGSMFIVCITNIIMGFATILCIIVILMMIDLIIESFIEYVKKGTIVKDFIEIIKLIIEALVDIFRFFIDIPKIIFLRVKDEKRRFKNSLEKELGRNEND